MIRLGRRLLVWLGHKLARAAEQRETAWPLSAFVIQRALRANPPTEERIMMLIGMAAIRTHEFERVGGSETSARSAIMLLTESVDLAPAGDEHHAALLFKLSQAQWRLYAATGDKHASTEAAHTARRALASVPSVSSYRVGLLEALVVWLAELADDLKEWNLLDDAVTAGYTGVAAGGTGLFNLGTVLRLRFEQKGDPNDLVEAERMLTGAIELSEAHGQTAVAELTELGHVLDLHHQVTGDPDLAFRAVDVRRRAVTLTERGDEWERPRQAAFADALLTSHRLGGPATLDEALAQVRNALGPSPSEPDFQTYYIAATMLVSWPQIRDQDVSALLAEAEAAARHAVTAAGTDAGDVADALDLLARVFQARFLSSGDRAHIDESIGTGSKAVEYPTSSTDDLAGRLANLGVALLYRFIAYGDTADLEAAITVHRRAFAAIPQGHHDRARYLSNLVVVLCHRYKVAGAVEDLNEAVGHGRAAVAATNQVGIERAHNLSNLGDALYLRYTRFGDVADLDEDIDLLREAIFCTPVRDADLAGLMSNLATGLRLRYTRLDSLDDLREALGVLEDAVRIAAPGIVRSTIVDAYGITLYAMGEATGERVWKSRAVSALSSVVIGSDMDADLPRRLTNLLSMIDHDTAAGPAEGLVTTVEEVIGALADNDPRLPGLRMNLASFLHARGQTGDTARAVREAEEAIRLTPSDHPDHAEYLTILGAFLRDVFARTGTPADLGRLLACLREAALADNATPVVRLRAARAWGQLAAENGDAVTAADALGLAVEQLAQVAPHRLERSDAQRWLADLSGLATSAAATCLENGHVERAVGVLELGRGVLLNRTLGIRNDTTELRRADRDLAVAFEQARLQLDLLDGSEPARIEIDVRAIGAEARALTAANTKREQRRDAVRRLTEVVDRIHKLPGFADFLQPPGLDDLLDSDTKNPVVIVNVSKFRCDAILLAGPTPRLVPLTLRADDVDRMAIELHQAVVTAADLTVPNETRAAAEDQVTQVLDLLWTAVARPVLDCLTPADHNGAIWWIPTGALALLPLHAATAADLSDSVLDRVVSSYAPTLTALAHARRRLRGLGRERTPVVVVSSHQDERSRPLHHAIEEATELAEQHGVVPVDAAAVNRNDLLTAIATASDLHVALHAVSDPEDPSRSRLRTGASHLTVTEIASLTIDHAWLAYLSACETTLTTAELADEAIHLTAAFQLAGFPHVVGTLWRIPDAVAARAARMFYRELRRTGGSPSSAAHQTTLHLRDRYRDSPATWAGYLHAGA